MHCLVFLPVEHLRPSFLLKGRLLVEIWGFLRHINDAALANFELLSMLSLVSSIAEEIIELLVWHIGPLRSCATTVRVFASIVEVGMMTACP